MTKIFLTISEVTQFFKKGDESNPYFFLLNILKRFLLNGVCGSWIDETWILSSVPKIQLFDSPLVFQEVLLKMA